MSVLRAAGASGPRPGAAAARGRDRADHRGGKKKGKSTGREAKKKEKEGKQKEEQTRKERGRKRQEQVLAGLIVVAIAVAAMSSVILRGAIPDDDDDDPAAARVVEEYLRHIDAGRYEEALDLLMDEQGGYAETEPVDVFNLEQKYGLHGEEVFTVSIRVNSVVETYSRANHTGYINVVNVTWRYDVADELDARMSETVLAYTARSSPLDTWGLRFAPFDAPPLEDGYEDDDNHTRATTLAADREQVHSLHNGSDVDWYTFTVGEELEVAISTWGDVGDMVMRLYDEEGVNGTAGIAYDDPGPGTFPALSVHLERGTYYLLVEPNGDKSEGVFYYYIAVSI